MGCLTEDLSLSKMKHHFVKSMVGMLVPLKGGRDYIIPQVRQGLFCGI